MLRQPVLNRGLGYEGVSVTLIIKKSPSVIYSQRETQIGLIEACIFILVVFQKDFSKEGQSYLKLYTQVTS